MKNIISKIRTDDFYKDLIVTFSGQMVVMLLSFILNKVISNQYSVSDFGVYSVLKRFTSVITFVMMMAMGIAIPKYVAEAKAKRNRKLTESYMISALSIMVIMFIVLTILLLFKRKFWAKLIFNDEKYCSYMLAISLYSLGNCLVTYTFSFYRGINAFIRYTFVNVMLQLIFIICTFVVRDNLEKLYLVWGVCAICYGLIEILFIFLKNEFNFKNLKQKLSSFQELFIYSLPRVPGEFILFAYALLPLTIVSYKFGTIQAGYFSAALSINSLVTPLFSLVGTILLPLVSGSKYNKNEEEVNHKIKVLGYMYIAVSFLSIIFVYLFGEFLLTLLFNKDYVESIGIVKIMIIAIIPNAYYLLLRNPLDGKSKFPYNTICLLVSFLLYIVLLLFSSSVEMCAVSTIIAYSVLGGLSLMSWIKISKK